MKRFFAIVLAAALLLTGCTHRQPTTAIPDHPPTADEVARAVLAACEGVETEAVTGEALDLWLTDFYRLPEGSWTDAALYRSANPMSAFEVAVIRLSEGADSREVMYRLEDYQYDREGDFFGYAPEQAQLVSNGLVCLSDNLLYAALLICKEPFAAADALSEGAARSSTAPPTSVPTPTPSPEPTPTPTPTPTPAPTPTPEPSQPPISHMMEIYDTDPILEAYRTGDESGLSRYDKTILKLARNALMLILEEGMSDYEKERAIYQWVVRYVSYDYDHYDKLEGASLDSSTPYNPLVKGKGICLGFATTFQLLADLAGLESIIVTGTAFSDGEDHAWNMVRLNGKWYCVDSTWDTGSGKPFTWNYFNVTSDYMKQTRHHWDEAAYPTATATDGGTR